MKTVFLIGFMACGKTTLGTALGTALPEYRFIDLDAFIEHENRCSITDIFTRDGELAFRRLEADALRRCAADNVIVACGGGTPCYKDNMDFMLAAGTVVWLRADTDTTVRRLLEAPAGQRPMISRLSGRPDELTTAVDKMIAEREPHYCRARHVFDSSHLETQEQIDKAVTKFIESFIIE